MLKSTSGLLGHHVKKTHADVEADLLKAVIKQANGSLQAPVQLDDPPSTNNLEFIFSQLAHKDFEKTYGFPFDGDQSAPTDIAPGTFALSSANGFCILRDGEDKDAAIESFVQKIIGARLPDWMSHDASDSLIVQSSSLVELSTYSDSWSSSPFVRTNVRSTVGDEYRNSICTNAVFIFLNASLKEEKVTASINTLYYTGIYYETVSAAKRAQDVLFENIYENAQNLISARISSTSSPHNLGDLREVLISYQSEQFLKYFEFHFDGSSPPKAFNNHIYQDSVLLHYEDGDISSFEGDIKAQVTSNLPVWIPKQASDELVSAFRACIEVGPYHANNWQSKKIDSQFSSNPDIDVVDNSGFVWCNASTVSQGYNISYNLIYYFGIFYEVRTDPASDQTSAVNKDLIRVLCDSGQRFISSPKVISKTPTEKDLDQILTAGCNQSFLNRFKFTFDGDQTKPLDITVGSPVFAAQVSFNESSINDNSAVQFVDAILKTLNFPKELTDSTTFVAIRNDLTTQVNLYFAADISNVVQISAPFQNQYDYSKSTENMLSTNALFVYSNASLPDPVHGDIAKMHIIYYIGVYYNIVGGSW